MDLPKLVVVAGGGIAGAACRWAVTTALDYSSGSFILVNGLGTLLLALLATRNGLRPASRTRLFAGVGFCGALTTFSALTVDIAGRLDEGQPGGAAAVLAASVVVGGFAIVLGGRRQGPAR